DARTRCRSIPSVTIICLHPQTCAPGTAADIEGGVVGSGQGVAAGEMGQATHAKSRFLLATDCSRLRGIVAVRRGIAGGTAGDAIVMEMIHVGVIGPDCGRI